MKEEQARLLRNGRCHEHPQKRAYPAFSPHQHFNTKTATLPTISTGQNGSGVATTTSGYYDNLDRLRWTQDGEGYIRYYAYEGR